MNNPAPCPACGLPPSRCGWWARQFQVDPVTRALDEASIAIATERSMRAVRKALS